MEKYRKFYTERSLSGEKQITFENTYDHYIETKTIPLIVDCVSYTNTTETTRKPDYKIQDVNLYDPAKKHVLAEKKISSHYILKDCRYISNKYSLVSMNLMLEKAIDNEVPFYKDYNEASPKPPYKFEYEIPQTAEYQILNDYLTLMKQISKEENADKNHVYTIPKEMRKEILLKYVHLSAHFGGLKNDFMTVKTGDHHFLEQYVFINQPVAPTIEDGRVNYYRETFNN